MNAWTGLPVWNSVSTARRVQRAICVLVVDGAQRTELRNELVEEGRRDRKSGKRDWGSAGQDHRLGREDYDWSVGRDTVTRPKQTHLGNLRVTAE